MTSMSTAQASVIVAAVVAFSVPAAYLQIRRAMRHNVTPEQIVRDSREARARARLIPAARDNRPGTDAAALDFIELTYGMPAYMDPELEAGCERLRQAIRDEQQNGDQK